MSGTTQLLSRQGVLAPGQSFDTGPMQVGPVVESGIGIRVPGAMRELRLFIASDQSGTMEVWQAQDFSTINTFPSPSPSRVASTTVAYVPGSGITQQITISAPYIRCRYTNGGVAATFADLWAAVTED